MLAALLRHYDAFNGNLTRYGVRALIRYRGCACQPHGRFDAVTPFIGRLRKFTGLNPHRKGANRKSTILRSHEKFSPGMSAGILHQTKSSQMVPPTVIVLLVVKIYVMGE